MENHYECWGQSELIERIEKMESSLRVLVRDWDFTDSEKNKSEVIKILKRK